MRWCCTTPDGAKSPRRLGGWIGEGGGGFGEEEKRLLGICQRVEKLPLFSFVELCKLRR